MHPHQNRLSGSRPQSDLQLTPTAEGKEIHRGAMWIEMSTSHALKKNIDLQA